MRRSWLTIVAGLMLAAGLTGEAEACRGKPCRWKAARAAYVQTPTLTARPVYATPYGVYATPYIAQPTPVIAQPAGNDAGAFLVALNQWRWQNGRPPLAWDPSLAAWAGSNAGVHDGRSSGGVPQVWAGTSSLTAALRLWQTSPAHAAILLTGTTVGASPSPFGSTANVR